MSTATASSLPPVLQLYKSIRRLHKPLRAVGNNYVKDEFARHRKAEPAFLAGFISEWTVYRDTLLQQVASSPFEGPAAATQIGKRLEMHQLDALNHQQLGQLHALREAAKGKKS
ncbi:hypothetical protein DFJ77DRAFT_515591 [Powellomyces hirtus]|nr:hypothetical protein DFJ77DRAFT_515591 [Powellomyces hirtus]